MKTLIAYASKSGTTKKCAEYLYDKVKDNLEAGLVDLKKSVPDISLYDTVVIGGPIRAGKLLGKVKSFMAKYQDSLKDKNLYIFFCCASDEYMEKYMKDNIPQALAESAKGIVSFGGEIDPDNAKGFDKFILNMMAKNMTGNRPCIAYENIDMLAEKLILIGQK